MLDDELVMALPPSFPDQSAEGMNRLSANGLRHLILLYSIQSDATRRHRGVVRIEREELTGRGRLDGFDRTAGRLPSVESSTHVADRLQAHAL